VTLQRRLRAPLALAGLFGPAPPCGHNPTPTCSRRSGPAGWCCSGGIPRPTPTRPIRCRSTSPPASASAISTTLAQRRWLNDAGSTTPAQRRRLNDAGRRQAQEFGRALRAAGAPITRILASPFCRAREAAGLTGLGAVTLEADLAERGLIVSPNENARRARSLRTLLGAAPAVGNTLLVGHRPNLLDAVGAEAFTVAEGELFAFRPHAEAPGVRAIGRLPIVAWCG